jgi:hypothetical protein
MNPGQRPFFDEISNILFSVSKLAADDSKNLMTIFFSSLSCPTINTGFENPEVSLITNGEYTFKWFDVIS